MVFGIAHGQLRSLWMAAGLTIGVRLHDESMQALEFPAVLHKIGCQPVKQLGMGGLATFGSKVIWVTGQWFTEMMLPYTIDYRACGQWIFRMSNPLCQCKPATSQGIGNLVMIFTLGGNRHSQGTQHPGTDFFTRSLQCAS